MQGRNRCGGKGLAMLFAPLCVTQVLAEAQESRDRLMTGGDRSEILPRSPAQSTVLFSSGRGGGRGREESINDQPSTITELKTSISDVSVDLSAPLFSDKRRANNALAAQHDTDILTNVKAKSKLFSLFQCNEISAVEQPRIRMK